MEKIFILTPESHDSDAVRWKNDIGGTEGYGYKPKDGSPIGLERCPECKKNNYAINVSSGVCTWCGFDANK